MLDAPLSVASAMRESGLVGKTFGQYHILSLIQRGGMGEIYLASLEPQKIKVVLKRLQDVHTDDERYVEMFQNEAAVMSGLEHPNIVKVLGVPVIEGKQCLVMEFVKGRNLQQVLSRLRKLGRKLPATLGIYILRKVLLGLHEAHHARFSSGRLLELVHRDVKPANILVSFAGDVKITDFGIAKSAMQNRMTTAGVVKGTVRYLSPEQIRSEKITFASDIFSCASVLVEILTDQPLYDRGPVAPTLMAILNDERAPIHELLPFDGPELAEVIERALHSESEKRYGSALDFAQALGGAARRLGTTVSDDDVGSLLRQLFQDSFSLSAPQPIEDVTYLLAGDNVSMASSRAPIPRGATPLDAREFTEEVNCSVPADNDSLLGASLLDESVGGTGQGHDRGTVSMSGNIPSSAVAAALFQQAARRDPTNVSPSPPKVGGQALDEVDPSSHTYAPKGGSMLHDVLIERPVELLERTNNSPPSDQYSTEEYVRAPVGQIQTHTMSRPGYTVVENNFSDREVPMEVPRIAPLQSSLDGNLRLYLLLGCLVGVVLTCVVLMIGNWSSG